jgi:hypothetical protein
MKDFWTDYPARRGEAMRRRDGADWKINFPAAASALRKFLFSTRLTVCRCRRKLDLHHVPAVIGALESLAPKTWAATTQ